MDHPHPDRARELKIVALRWYVVHAYSGFEKAVMRALKERVGLNNLGDFRALMNNPAFKQASGLRITVERAGKPVVIEYRQGR